MSKNTTNATPPRRTTKTPKTECSFGGSCPSLVYPSPETGAPPELPYVGGLFVVVDGSPDELVDEW
jgi:hypothetical protein